MGEATGLSGWDPWTLDGIRGPNSAVIAYVTKMNIYRRKRLCEPCLARMEDTSVTGVFACDANMTPVLPYIIYIIGHTRRGYKAT